MITSTQIYWLLMLDNINVGVVLLGCAVFIIGLLWMFYGADEQNKTIVITGVIIMSLSIPFGFSAVFIPTTKQMATIIVAPKIINNEQVQKIPNQVLELANEWLEELKPNKGE